MRHVFAIATFVAIARAAAAEEAWYPSKYGKDDTIGAANNLSPAIVVEAARLVKTGRTYSLGVTTGPDSPAFGKHRSFQIFTEAFVIGEPLGTNRATANDDFLATWMGIGSQLDGLGHLGIDFVYYNGHKERDFLRPHGLLALSTDKVPPIVTRGVLLDIARLKGGPLAGGTAISKSDIEAAVERQGTPIRKGDVVLIHTGWLASKEGDPKAFLESEPGLGKEGASYLASLGVVAVGADSWGVEVLPFEDPKEAYPVHQILLARNGVYLLENMNVGPLAADEGYEFLFVLGQPKFAGAVQAVINPVAIR